MRDETLAWTVEDACMNAWPCPRQLLLDGYLLRSAGGATRRTNSVNPLRGAGPPEPVIAACEAVYAGLGRPAIFRVPEIAPGLDAPLDRRGYVPQGESRTLLADLSGLPGTTDAAVSLRETPDADWFALREAVNGAGPEAEAVFRAMTGLIALPRAFALLRAEAGTPAAIAYAAVDRGLVVIESVATHASFRGRGFGTRTVGALLRWGRARGAGTACLQVAAENRAGRALYARLGFGRELYRYHYRVRPAGA